jgi:hypothetical protein
MKHPGLILVCLALPASLMLQAQNADQGTVVASITFERTWNEFTPQNVTITVSANGAVKYSSRNLAKTGDDVDEYQTEFTVSPAHSGRLFRYAKEANYFQGDFTFKKHAVAGTGTKKLTYSDSARHFNTAFDYSDNKAIQEITNFFQGVSNTIEQGRKLQFMHRFDKLGLEDELKAMESAAESHNLEELQIIASTLESIAGDRTVLNIARQRAQRLLAKASSQ